MELTVSFDLQVLRMWVLIRPWLTGETASRARRARLAIKAGLCAPQQKQRE